MKIRVRISNMLDGLLQLAQKDVPAIFRSFVSLLISDGVYIPSGLFGLAVLAILAECAYCTPCLGTYLFPSERAQLAFSRFGSTDQMTPTRQRMMVTQFFIGRVLLSMVRWLDAVAFR